jgi:hypothetical protein
MRLIWISSMINNFTGLWEADMALSQTVKINDTFSCENDTQSVPTVGRVRRYENDAARVKACLARKGKRSATFALSPEVLSDLDDFMRRRVDSNNPSETRSQVVERALSNFFRKR